MQPFLMVVRHMVYPAAVLLLLWAAYLVFASPYISDSSGKILAVYDGDSAIEGCGPEIALNKENQSEDALAGFCKAAGPDSGGKVELLNVHSEQPDGTEGKLTAIYQRLASRIARGSVLAVISFLASPDSPPVVRFCRAMHIPLLLAVAANDDLMAPSEDTKGIVFRMIPKNGQQAKDMAEWLRERLREPLRKQASPSPGLRVALFHEPNSFGEFLHRKLTQELQPQLKDKKILTYDFEVREQLEFADLMSQLWCERIDTVIYLGFAARGVELLNQLGSYKADPDAVPCKARKDSRSFDELTVLLSSGAYQDDLKDKDKYNFNFKVVAMLPTSPCRDDNAADSSPYGYDSFQVVQRLAAGGVQDAVMGRN